MFRIKDCKAHPDEKGTERLDPEQDNPWGETDCKAHPDEKGTERKMSTTIRS